MHQFPRPADQHLSVDRQHAPGSCPECGAEDLATYRVLSDGGWWDVRKCQACLCSVERTPAGMFGDYVPLALTLDR